MRFSRPVAATALLLATALAGTPALTSSAGAVADDGDDGRAPVSRAADRYGMSEAELEAMMEDDPSLRVSGAGLYYVDPAVPRTEPTPRVTGQAFPLADTFTLHSKPGSNRVIYLDFTGHNVSNTWWNQEPDPIPNGDHPPFSLDGDPNNFNDAERLLVQDVFQRVAEDYAPFDVDVTTQDPGEAAIIRSGAGDLNYGTRALITPSEDAINGICGGNCGGVAFIDVFDDPTLNGVGQPAWVFPQALGNDPKYIADATTHEVGHNLSLIHDGTTSLDYYSGHSGLWGPIMGAPYDVPVTQFGLNQYPGAKLGGPGGNPPYEGYPDGLQPSPDDLAVIAASGTPVRADEPGTSIGTAGPVPAGGGVISSRTDVDYFSLGTCSGPVSVSANNAEVSPNLDIELQLLSAGGAVLDTDNPAVSPVNYTVANGMDAVASADVASGQYYVRIDGVGPGSTTTAYDDYGSVGAYTLQVTGCSGGPVVTAPSVPLNLVGSYEGGGIVLLDWDAPADDGGASITEYNVYLDDVFLGSIGGDETVVQVTDSPQGAHDYAVSATNSAGESPLAHVTVDASDPQAVPGRPRIGTATQGRRGAPLTAKISWLPPAAAANPAIDGYDVVVFKLNNRGRYVRVYHEEFPATTNLVQFTFSGRATFKFAVRAHNSLGWGVLSAKSNSVVPR